MSGEAGKWAGATWMDDLTSPMHTNSPTSTWRSTWGQTAHTHFVTPITSRAFGRSFSF